MDDETRKEFAVVHARLDRVDDRLERMMRGVAQQFETMQKYMDRRFDEVLEALDFRYIAHERRIRRLEESVFRES